MDDKSRSKHVVTKALSRLERERDLQWARLVATTASSLRLEPVMPVLERDLKKIGGLDAFMLRFGFGTKVVSRLIRDQPAIYLALTDASVSQFSSALPDGIGPVLDVVKVPAFLKDAIWTFSSEESLIKAVMAEVEKNPESYFSDLPGLVNRCIARVGELLEAEADWPWRLFFINAQLIVKLKLSAEPIGKYLKREGLLSSLPGRMDIVASAVVQIVRKDPAQYFSIEISESQFNLALSGGLGPALDIVKVRAFLKNAIWNLRSEESLIKAVRAEVEKNPESYFSDLPGQVNRCATRVGKLLEAEADWPWKQFLTNTQSILKLKLGIHPIRAYLKRERLLSSLPGRMDIVARAIVQIVRKDPAQYFFIEISESILRSLALSLKKSDVEFGGVPIRRLIEDSKSFKDCRSFFPQMQQRLSFLRDNVPAVISALPQNESIQLDIDSVRAFVNSVIWTSPSEADIVRMLAEAIIKNPKAYFSRVRAPASEERSYPSSTRSRPDPAMC